MEAKVAVYKSYNLFYEIFIKKEKIWSIYNCTFSIIQYISDRRLTSGIDDNKILHLYFRFPIKRRNFHTFVSGLTYFMFRILKAYLNLYC